MNLWKLTGDTINEYNDNDEYEDLLFKRKGDAEVYAKAMHQKFLHAEKADEYGQHDMTYEEYAEEYNVKIVPVKVRLDGKTERVIFQRKS